MVVIFESEPLPGKRQAYLDAGAALHAQLGNADGFISIERFESLTTPGRLLALSFWRDEEAVRQWRNVPSHRRIQDAGRENIFADYRLRVASVVRDYTMRDRGQAPRDSQAIFAAPPPKTFSTDTPI